MKNEVFDMSPTIDLTIEQRYLILKYIYRIPCTISVRLTIDTFVDTIALSEDESKKYSVDFVDGLPVASDKEYVRSYQLSEFGPIYEAVKDYVDYLSEVVKANPAGAAKTKDILDALSAMVLKA